MNLNSYYIDIDKKICIKYTSCHYYTLKINNSRDALRYRLFSIIGLIKLVEKDDITTEYNIPTELHQSFLQFKKTTPGKTKYFFYKLYFLELIIKLKQLYSAFSQLDEHHQIHKLIKEFDNIFLNTYGINPIWYGMAIKIEMERCLTRTLYYYDLMKVFSSVFYSIKYNGEIKQSFQIRNNIHCSHLKPVDITLLKYHVNF